MSDHTRWKRGPLQVSRRRARRLVASLAATMALAVLAPAGAFALGGISGTVTAEVGGAPVPNFEVEIYAGGALVPTDTQCTTAGGTYQSLIAAGSYEVRFSGDAGPCGAQSNFAPEWWNSHFSRSFADQVIVTEGATTSGVNASLQDGGRIAGTVTDSTTAAPLANVTVELLGVTGTPVLSACTAADGTYALDPVVPGVYSVEFVANGTCGNAGSYLLQWYDGSSTQAGATGLNIAAGVEITSVNSALVPGTGPGPGASPPPPGAGTTGLRAAALKKCKKKKSNAARKKCRKKAGKLPL
jgi:hypothetical protein